MANFTINELASASLLDTDNFIKSNDKGVLSKINGSDIKRALVGPLLIENVNLNFNLEVDFMNVDSVAHSFKFSQKLCFVYFRITLTKDVHEWTRVGTLTIGNESIDGPNMIMGVGQKTGTAISLDVSNGVISISNAAKADTGYYCNGLIVLK